MQVSGVPAAIAAGSTICLTLRGASGSPHIVGSGSVKLLSVTQSTTEPSAWIICVQVGRGAGVVLIEDATQTKAVALSAK